MLIGNDDDSKEIWSKAINLPPDKYLDVSNLDPTGRGTRIRVISARYTPLKIASTTELGIVRFSEMSYTSRLNHGNDTQASGTPTTAGRAP